KIKGKPLLIVLKIDKSADTTNKGYLTLPADHSVCKNPHNKMATILEIANADRNLSIMMKGLKAANLEESLSGIGPFTILAPVNLAFGKLVGPDTFLNLVKESSSNS